MAKSTRIILGGYFEEFLERDHEVLLDRNAIGSPLKLYVLFESFVREKVLDANPDLGEVGNASRTDSLVRRIIPEFQQFVGMLLDRMDMPPPSPPLQTPNVRKGFVKGRTMAEETGLR